MAHLATSTMNKLKTGPGPGSCLGFSGVQSGKVDNAKKSHFRAKYHQNLDSTSVLKLGSEIRHRSPNFCKISSFSPHSLNMFKNLISSFISIKKNIKKWTEFPQQKNSLFCYLNDTNCRSWHIQSKMKRQSFFGVLHHN